MASKFAEQLLVFRQPEYGVFAVVCGHGGDCPSWKREMIPQNYHIASAKTKCKTVAITFGCEPNNAWSMKKKVREFKSRESKYRGMNHPWYELASCREVIVMFLVKTENKRKNKWYTKIYAITELEKRT